MRNIGPLGATWFTLSRDEIDFIVPFVARETIDDKEQAGLCFRRYGSRKVGLGAGSGGAS